MTTPFPKELAMFASSGKQLDDLLDIVRAYGAAEYKRGVEDAAKVCDTRSEAISDHLEKQVNNHAVTSATDFSAGVISASRRNARHIRKLGETS